MKLIEQIKPIGLLDYSNVRNEKKQKLVVSTQHNTFIKKHDMLKEKLTSSSDDENWAKAAAGGINSGDKVEH